MKCSTYEIWKDKWTDKLNGALWSRFKCLNDLKYGIRLKRSNRLWNVTIIILNDNDHNVDDDTKSAQMNLKWNEKKNYTYTHTQMTATKTVNRGEKENQKESR